MEKQDFFTAFVNISKAICSSLNLREVLDLIVKHAVEALNLKAGAISLWDKKTNRLELIAHHNLSREFLNKGPILADKSIPNTIKSMKAVVVPNTKESEQIQYPKAFKKEGILSLISVPIIFKGLVIGVLRLYGSEPRDFTDREIEFITALSEQGAIAIENARYMQKVLEEHKRDIKEIWDWFESTYQYPRILD